MTIELIARTQHLLVARALELVSDDQFMAWVDTQMLAVRDPGTLARWFIELAAHGPARFAQQSERERGFNLPEIDSTLSFAALIHQTNPANRTNVVQFIRTLIHGCGGGDLNDPAIALGYEFDHLLNDCDELDLAIARAREELEARVESATAVLAPLLALVAEAVAAHQAT